MGKSGEDRLQVVTTAGNLGPIKGVLDRVIIIALAIFPTDGLGPFDKVDKGQ